MILPRSTTDFCLACACAMSEAELFVMRARLQGGILNKARRGALKLTLPIGLCYTEEDAIVLDPDVQVQASIGEVFRSFAHTGSACATVRHFRKQHLLFARRVRSGAHQGEIVWGDIQHHDVLRVLHHPAYAGAYAFGRTRTTKTADGKVHIEDVPRSEWVVLMKEVHVGSISWEDYERNEAQLAMNSQAYAPERFSPPARPSCALAGPHSLWPVWRTHDGALSPASRKPHCARLSLRAHKH
jgi:Recombinase